MGVFDRTLLALYSFIMGILSVYVFLLSLGWTSLRQMLNLTLDNSDQRMVLAILAVVFFLISVRLFISSMHKEKTMPSAIVQDTALGQVRMTIQALEGMVRRSVYQLKGVREINPHIVSDPSGVSVLIRAIVTPDISVPAITEQMQDQVKAYLEEVAGITVHSVKILVENISTESRARVE